MHTFLAFFPTRGWVLGHVKNALIKLVAHMGLYRSSGKKGLLSQSQIIKK